MPRDPSRIADELDELAAELEAEAKGYREMAHQLRRRSVTASAALAASMPTMEERVTRPLADTQNLIVHVMSASPDGAWSAQDIHTAMLPIGGPETVTAVRTGLKRLVSSGRVERAGHGRYRLIADRDSTPRLVIHPGADSLFVPDRKETG